MEKTEILQQVEKIFIKVLKNTDIHLTESSTAYDIDEWDSLHHIQIVYSIEKHFKISFGLEDVLKWKNVGDMCDSIIKILDK